MTEAREQVKVVLSNIMKDFVSRFIENKEMIEILFKIKQDESLKR